MSINNESKRLSEIYPLFDEDVLEAVEKAADIHRGLSWDEFSATLPDNEIYHPKHGKPIEVLDIIPDGEIESVQVYRTPTLNSLDSNQRDRIGVLALAQPNTRIIGIGNPAAPGQNAGRIRFWNFPSVARGNLRSFVDPVFDYLGEKGIERSIHTGHSGGAEMTVAAPEYAEKHDQHVPQIIPVEPVAVSAIGLIGLGQAAKRTLEALDGYVEQADSQAIVDAREEALKQAHGELGQNLALLRLTNLALFLYMSGNGFEQRLDNSLTTSPDTRADIISASESEYVSSTDINRVAERLIKKFGGDRVTATSLKGERHLFPDDVFLNAAVTLQNAKKLKTS
jgi:hypothetical protein